MVWTLIGVGVGVAVGLSILAVTRRTAAESRPSSEQLTVMGTVFLAVGGGTIATIGFIMLGMVAVGLVLLAAGFRLRKAEERATSR
jgi:hypothetical protein